MSSLRSTLDFLKLSCSLNDFMEEMAPWLDSDYIREARVDERGNVVLLFQDGVTNVYRIDDCSREQVEKVLKELKDRGIGIA